MKDMKNLQGVIKLDLQEWTKIEENVNEPKPFKKVKVTDGNIVDTGFTVAGNWYLDNYYKIIGEITHWKYV